MIYNDNQDILIARKVSGETILGSLTRRGYPACISGRAEEERAGSESESQGSFGQPGEIGKY